MNTQEHRNLPSKNKKLLEFRAVYHAYRLAIRLEQRKFIPSSQRKTLKILKNWEGYRAEMLSAAEKSHRFWIQRSEWTDPLIGAAQRKLVRQRTKSLRIERQKMLRELHSQRAFIIP